MPARWGVTLPMTDVALRDHEPLVRRVEAAGYDDLWTGETAGPDGFTPLALAATWTERVRLGTGIVNPFTRGPAVLAQHAAALQDISGGRFCLGLGSSSDVIVQRWNGIPFERPRARVRDALLALRPVLAGERGAGGFRLESPPAEPIPIFVAALRDRMLALAGELADGAIANFLPLSAVEHVVAQVRAAERAAGRDKGAAEIVCRFFCVPGDEPEAMRAARRMLAAYGTVPVYEQFYRSLGWGERIDPMVTAWRGGDRKLALERVPDDLVREIFILGEPARQRERLARFAAAGIDTLVLTPIAAPDRLPELIDALAPGDG